MRDNYPSIESLLRRVRARWQRLRLFKASVNVALAASAILGIALIAGRFAGRSPVALALVAVTAFVAIVAAMVWRLLPLRHSPADQHVARFIEERAPSLDDRLVSAVDVVRTERTHASPAIVGPMLADAARRVEALDLDSIVPRELLTRAAFQAVAALVLLAAVLLAARKPAREAFDAASLALFPGRITIEVKPGNARVKAGTPFSIDARLVGQPRARRGARRASGGRPRACVRNGDAGRGVSSGARPGDRIVHLSCRCGHGEVARLHGHGRACAPCASSGRRLHVSVGARPEAAHRGG